MPKLDPPTSRRVIFSFLVPVCVEVEDDIVRKVVVLDEASVVNPKYVSGARKYLKDAVTAALNGQDWPGWEFGW